MKLQIFLALQLFFNGALSGYQWTNNIEGRNTNRTEWILLILSILFGLEMIIISIVWVNLEQFWEWFGGVTQWQFYHHFYFTKKYDKMEEAQWKNIDHRYELTKKKLASGGKIKLSSQEFMICTELLYKRFDRKHKTQEQYDTEERERDRKDFETKQLAKWNSKVYRGERDEIPCCGKCNMYLTPNNNNCEWCGEEAEFALRVKSRTTGKVYSTLGSEEEIEQ